MTTFLQFHILVSYPPSNLNRDDLGRPKTATFGGKQRLRISSQALKRAWRTGPMFEALSTEHMGQRTKLVGVEAYKEMLEAGIDEEKAKAFGIEIAKTFAKTKKAKPAKKSGDDEASPKSDLTELETEQLVHVSPVEREAIRALIRDELMQADKWDKKWSATLLQSESKACDIAMFGRMLADNPKYNVEAAVQVSHAITAHEVVVEDDYFSAVDDLNVSDGGAGHIGELNFGSGIFYVYVNVNVDDLIKNLSGDRDLAKDTVIALARSCARVAPSGKQNSFAAHAYAHYMLVERGEQTPRQLSMGFASGEDRLAQPAESVKALVEMRDKFDRVYGPWAKESASFDVSADESVGDMKGIEELIKGAFHG